MTWSTSKVIGTPRGDYSPTSDDLKAELVNAARSAGLEHFRVYHTINGHEVEVENPADLQTNSIEALVNRMRVDGAGDEPQIARVAQDDKVAC